MGQSVSLRLHRLGRGMIGRLCIAFTALAVSDVSAITYLKADAPDGGDGSSWAAAFRNVEEAVARASASEDKTLYAAKGIYVVTNKMEVADGFRIYGGFAGLAMDEDLAGRDVEKNQTILTGDRDLDDCWCHVVPVPGEYRKVATNLVDETVISNGVVHFPPPYMGEFDAYQPEFRKKNSQGCFSALAGVSSVYDGLWFTGFGNNGNDGNCIAIQKEAKETIVHDCRFIGNRTNHGQIGDLSGQAKITRCQFRFGMTIQRAAGVCTRGTTLIEDCIFESLPRDGANGGGVIFFWGLSGTMVRRCVFTRSITISNAKWHESTYNGGGNIVASEGGEGVFVDCVISNTFTASPFERGTPTVAIRNGSLLRCSFINNRYEVKPVGGRTYVLFGNACAKNYKLTYEGCAFRGNVIAAPVVEATSGMDYALGIVGNAGDGHRLAVVGCTFDSNRVEYMDKEGVTPVCSRGLVSSAMTMNTKTELGVANCTFTGPFQEGLYDIVQYGSAHQTPLVVLNSVFMGDRSVAVPAIYASAPDKVFVHDCTIENVTALPEGITQTGLQGDTVPFVREDEATVSHVPVLIPSAKTPAIRETADLATNTPSTLTATFRYRLRGEADWRKLWSTDGNEKINGADPLPLSDPNGHMRPFGSTTRGAAQPLTSAAETGHTLLLRCDPYYNGTLSDPSSQAVGADEPIKPVTAIPFPGRAFHGWYHTDGTLYASEATLEIPSLSEDMTLIARFGSPKVNVVFKLGEAGRFTANDSPTISIPVEAGGNFPPIPPYVESDAWHVYEWDRAFPPTVPEADCAFHAKYVTKDVRVIHVVPEDEVPAGGDGSGDSWQNPMSDLKAAYLNAARYRGEVWLKEGTYRVDELLAGKPNVSILGGFAGTESSSAEADPAAHPTVLTGDINGDTYWQACRRGVSTSKRDPVWTDGVFLEPNPADDNEYWTPTGNRDDDFADFFTTSLEPVTNAVFSGLTLTCFREHVLKLASGVPDVVIRDCRFLANGQSVDDVPIQVSDGRVRVENCEFVGNIRCCSVTTADPNHCSSFSHCVFRENSSSKSVCLHVGLKAGLDVSDCLFDRNCSTGSGYGCPGIAYQNARELKARNCLFQENRLLSYDEGNWYKTDSAGVIGFFEHQGGDRPLVEGCRFIGNRGTSIVPNGHVGICLHNYGWSVKPDVVNCYFASNRLEVAEVVTNGNCCVIGQTAFGGYLSFINCTVEDNEVVNHSSKSDFAGMIGGYRDNVIVNCLFDNNRFTGPGAEFVWKTDVQSLTFSMVNTVVRNDSPGYRPFLFLSPTQTVNFADCAISGVDTNTLPVEPRGYCWNVTSAPGGAGRVRKGPGDVLARGISSDSPYVHAGRPVWCADDGYYYIYDEAAVENHVAPWCRLGFKNQRFGSIPGISVDSEPIPDAFDGPRRKGRIAYGPLNAIANATVLQLR